MNLHNCRYQARQTLPALSERLLDELLCSVFSVSRHGLYAYPEMPASAKQRRCLDALLQRLVAGEPQELVLGHCTFDGLRLQVRPGVFVPRPETEGMVAQAAKLLPPSGMFADVGTGSGAIALAVKSARLDAQVTGTDISSAALELAAANGIALGLEVQWLQGNLCAPLATGAFDLIISNPPYVEAGFGNLPELLRYEPESALNGGVDGLDVIKSLIGESGRCLKPSGCLLLEHGAGQGQRVRRLLAENGFTECRSEADEHGLERFSSGRWARR